MKEKVEHLYFGDKRLDTLYEAVDEMIMDRCGGSDIPMLSVIGVLNRLIYRYNILMDGDEWD